VLKVNAKMGQLAALLQEQTMLDAIFWQLPLLKN
jgi:hypothetical protein